jgi:hypothetical protein
MKRRTSKKTASGEADVLKEAAVPFETGAEAEPMVRTQIYLSKSEHEFVQSESVRRDEPMAAVIRSFIDEKMIIPDRVWEKSPLLDDPADPNYVGLEDGGINHDHYVYGCPKKYEKVNGKWVWKPLPKQ